MWDLREVVEKVPQRQLVEQRAEEDAATEEVSNVYDLFRKRA
jgi:hypothetical protein